MHRATAKPDGAAVLLHNLFRNPKTQARSNVHLGGEERLKYLFHVRCRNSRPVIRNHNPDPASTSISLRVSRRNPQADNAIGTDRVDTVAKQIGKYLPQFPLQST